MDWWPFQSLSAQENMTSESSPKIHGHAKCAGLLLQSLGLCDCWLWCVAAGGS